jgi:hypothetical protein
MYITIRFCIMFPTVLMHYIHIVYLHISNLDLNSLIINKCIEDQFVDGGEKSILVFSFTIIKVHTTILAYCKFFFIQNYSSIKSHALSPFYIWI